MKQTRSPSLRLAWDVFEKNVNIMASHLDSSGLRWRPHVKSHCSGRLAAYLLDHGATGVTVATLPQARMMIESGIRSVLLTTPVGIQDEWIDVGDLQDRGEVIVAIDSLQHLAALTDAAPQGRIPLLVELDLGLSRTGVRSVEAALELAIAVSTAPHARFVGFMGYEGHVFRVWPEQLKQSAYQEALAPLTELVAEAKRIGLDVGLVSGGGTGSLFVDASVKVFNESQAGGGVFMDLTYLEDFHVPYLEPALFIDATVIAVHPPSSAVIDTGFKLFGQSRRLPAPVGASLEVGAVSAHMSMLVGDVAPLQVGSTIRLWPGYSDATMHNFRELLVDGSERKFELHAADHAGSRA